MRTRTIECAADWIESALWILIVAVLSAYFGGWPWAL